MAKKENKTKPTDVSPSEFIASVDHDRRRQDAEILLELFEKVSGHSPKMWGPSMIGYGQYHYKYESGREGDSFRLGFSPRKSNLVVYLMPGYQDFDEERARLGKHKLGKACLYINKLADIDLDVLEEMARKSLRILAEKYPTDSE